MSGAVGLWLWGKPAEMRGGSLSVWRSHDDLQRFVRWPVHAAIMSAWRNRIGVRARRWADARFHPERVWLAAEQHMKLPREASASSGRRAR